MRLAAHQGLEDDQICRAVDEMNEGLIDASLGASLFKKRIAMPGHGKRGSWRTLLGFQEGEKAFFLYLFPKNRLPNIQDKELKALKHLAKFYVALKPGEIRAALDSGELREVNCDE